MAAGSAIELGELMKEIEELKKQVDINVIRCGHCEYKHRSKSKIKEHIRLYHNNGHGFLENEPSYRCRWWGARSSTCLYI